MDKLAANSLRVARRSTRFLHSTTVGGLRAESSTAATASADSGANVPESEASSSTSSTSVSQTRTFSNRPGRTDFNADYDILKTAGDFQFDDATSLGWLRLEKIREAQELYRKVAVDRDVLKGG